MSAEQSFNFLNITGDKREIKKFLRKASCKTDSRHLVMNNIIPYDGDYEWWINNWGSCRDVTQGSTFIEKYGDATRIVFSTDYSPPKKFVEKVSVMFPDLLFELYYFIENEKTNGRIKVKNGKILIDEEKYQRFNRNIVI